MARAAGAAQEIVFRVRGRREAAHEASPAELPGLRGAPETTPTPARPAGDGGDAGQGCVVLDDGATRGAAADTHELRARVGLDLVRVHVDGGPVLHLHPQTAALLLAGPPAEGAPDAASPRRRGARGAQAAAVAGVVDVQARVGGWAVSTDATAPTRGLVGDAARWLVVRAIEVVVPDLKQEAARAGARALVAQVDAQVHPGVYALPREGALQRFRAQQATPLAQLPARPGGLPLLVLIHGTFVETSSTFGPLWAETASVRTLFDHYGGAVYALDHPTLGANPVENALTLAEALPDDAVLHLLTHSRGGLVAEVLARVAAMPALDDAARAAFVTPASRAALERLHACLQRKRVRVERVVRVACPARGTLLASGRLDVLLSVMTWLLRLSGAPLAAELVSFLDAVARQRTDPAVVPGLQAMMPTSGLVRWLNTVSEPIPGTLRVVAGDLSGQGVGSVLKTLLADAFYWSDNDIVVHTGAMYGGAPRRDEASFVLERSAVASHFDYFRQPHTRQAILAGLTQDRPADFRPIGALSWRGASADGLRGAVAEAVPGTLALTRGGATAAPAAVPTRPLVVVLPGLLGSNLARRGTRIWLGLRLLGGLDELAWHPDQDDGIEPDGPISRIYQHLLVHLQRSHDVVAFDFDWRVPLAQEAKRLADELHRQLALRPGQPVRLLAHSMGGVLARVMALEHPQVWAELMARDGARLVMLGTPNGGSWAPMQVLSGDDPFGNLLVTWGAPLSERRARQMMAGFPGFMALQAGLTDPALALDQAATWQRLAEADLADMRRRSWWHGFFGAGDGQTEDPMLAHAWGVPPQAVLDQAVALRRRLDEQAARFETDPLLAARCCLVVGRAEPTAEGFEVDPERGFVYREAERGDGRVTLADACLPGVPTWSCDVAHGDLPREAALFEAYRELLETGGTVRLPRISAPPAAVRGGAAAAGAAAGRVFRLARVARAPWPAPHPDDALAPQAESQTPAVEPSGAAIAAPLRVRVVNGNLRHVDCPLFIGHYVSMTLTGAERAVDWLIGRTMSASLALQTGHYPEAPGTHQIFLRVPREDAPLDGPGPTAAIVVGLGQEGRLRPAELETTVMHGVLAWLQREHEAHARSGVGGTRAPVVVAATLIGSGGWGITAGASARTLAQAVVRANARAAAAKWPVVGELRFIELFMDRAAEAWRELTLSTQDDAGAAPFALEPLIGQLPGARRRPLDGSYRGADYDLVRIYGTGGGHIEFALDTRRARSEVREQSLQADLVHGLVQAIATDDPQDRRLGQTLFKLLVPPALEPYLAGQGRLLLDLNDSTASLPWELLDTEPHPDREPWALRAGLLRTLQTASERPAGRRDARRDDAVLVIGDPRVTRPGFADLPAARAEAQAVQARFAAATGQTTTETRTVIGGDALTVLHALLDRDWRIIHVAGHGEWREGKGGILLSGEHNVIGPAEIASMRAVPELVFVNCCYLARMDGDAAARRAQASFARGQFAAGVAEELIRMGVRCVVAAGWAVGDEAAQVFATTFYRELLEGAGFGDAVTTARRATYRAEGHGADGNTWAAYQCYGDPEWRLVVRQRQGASTDQGPQDRYKLVASAPALALALETLVIEAEGRSAGRPEALADVRWLEDRFAPHYGDIGAVAEAFALAYAAHGEREAAQRWAERAYAAPDGTATLRVARQLGRLPPPAA